MMNRVTDRSSFKAEVLPNIEPLLQIALWLTRNGLDANKLLREALAEAYRSWKQAVPEGRCDIWLKGILISRFSDGVQQNVSLTTPAPNDGDEIFSGVGPGPLPTRTAEWQQSRLTRDPDGDNYFFEAMVSLPTVCRSAMILSYLEGVSNENKGIADLSGVQPQAADPKPSPGRTFIREELFEHLMDGAAADSGAGSNTISDQLDPKARSVILNLNANIDSHAQRISNG